MKICTTCKKTHSESTVRCASCKERSRGYQRKFLNRGKENNMCRLCAVRKPDEGLKSCTKCRTRIRDRKKVVKKEVFAHYGGRCVFCMESDLRHLTIDHIDGNGAEHRREMQPGGRFCGDTIYSWLKRNDWPTGYQILCWNCNTAKYHYNIDPKTDPEMLLAAAGVI